MDGGVKQIRKEFESGELDQLLAEGERSDKPLLARVVFKELRELGKRAKNPLRKPRRGQYPPRLFTFKLWSNFAEEF